MNTNVADRVVEWALARPEFAGFSVERDVELKGNKIKGRPEHVLYQVDAVLIRRSRLSFIFRSGPMSGSAIAITVARGSMPMTERDVAGVQRMAMDVFQSSVRGREKLPIKLWVHVTTQPYDEDARRLAGQIQLTWFGHIDKEGNVEQVL